LTARKPKYLVEVWQEDEWWIAEVVGVADGSDISPLGRVTQAESRDTIEDWARDLIATILDAGEDTFDIEVANDDGLRGETRTRVASPVA